MFGGNFTSGMISRHVTQQLVAAVAESANVTPVRVTLVTYRESRRMLLAVSVTFELLVATPEEALKLQERIEKANMQVLELSYG
jgi:hypothetical protein